MRKTTLINKKVFLTAFQEKVANLASSDIKRAMTTTKGTSAPMHAQGPLIKKEAAWPDQINELLQKYIPDSRLREAVRLGSLGGLGGAGLGYLGTGTLRGTLAGGVGGAALGGLAGHRLNDLEQGSLTNTLGHELNPQSPNMGRVRQDVRKMYNDPASISQVLEGLLNSQPGR